MRIIRFFFTKTGEAAYISHLDLQRVMARALRRSGLPVWYSKGFNPHIYMTFSLPLPLMQESIAETMDCKTESDLADFSQFIKPLNAALPKGLVVKKIAFPVYGAALIEHAEYMITYPASSAGQALRVAEGYNALSTAVVVRKTKRTEQEMDLKLLVPTLQSEESENGFTVLLPAGGQFNINPDLLTGLLEREFGLPAAGASVLRTQVYAADGGIFC